MAVSDRTDSATPCAVHGRPARIAEGRIYTPPRFLTLKLLPFSAPPGGIYLISLLCFYPLVLPGGGDRKECKLYVPQTTQFGLFFGNFFTGGLFVVYPL